MDKRRCTCGEVQPQSDARQAGGKAQDVGLREFERLADLALGLGVLLGRGDRLYAKVSQGECRCDAELLADSRGCLFECLGRYARSLELLAQDDIRDFLTGRGFLPKLT